MAHRAVAYGMWVCSTHLADGLLKVNSGVDEERGWFGRPLAGDHVAGWIDNQQIAHPQFGPMHALGIEQKSIGRAGDDEAEVIAYALAQPQPVCPTQGGGEINLGLLGLPSLVQGFVVCIHNDGG